MRNGTRAVSISESVICLRVLDEVFERICLKKVLVDDSSNRDVKVDRATRHI